jgi:hypothetical protein
MNNFKVTKMDRRHTGHEVFSHYINYNVYVRGGQVAGGGVSNEVNFIKARIWFWEKFGPSAELGMSHRIIAHREPVQWAWQSEHHQLRIYVTEKALDFFLLTHSA